MRQKIDVNVNVLIYTNGYINLFSTLREKLLKACRIVINKKWRKITPLIKDFNALVYNGKNIKTMYWLQDLSSLKVLENRKQICLKINSKQNIKTPKGLWYWI